jgi:rubrerythrin
MNKLITRIIDESINVESNLSILYSQFGNLFSEDSEFWSQLASEEKDHASLLLRSKTLSSSSDNFPVEILSQDLETVISTNKMIEELILCSHGLSDREKAGRIALRIERSSTELSFERFLNTASDSELSKVFAKLNYYDKNHAKRICEYFKIIDTGF